MRFLPLGIDLFDRQCVVVGGGAIGTRKALTLLHAGAPVTVVSPKVTGDLAREIDAGRIRWVREGFREEHLEGAFLVVMATDDRILNELGGRLAAERRILSCVTSAAMDSQVIFGALLDHGGATVATFTDGRDPALARRTRDEIGALLAAGSAPGPGAGPPGGAVLVLVAHGSRNPLWSTPLVEMVGSIADELGGAGVRLAYSQFASPTLEQVVEEEVRAGRRRFRILPLFMTDEGHVDRDIRPVLEGLRAVRADLQMDLLPAVGRHPSFRKLLVSIAKEITP